jgi:hypothetical protein
MDLTCYVLHIKKEVLGKLGFDSSPGTCINQFAFVSVGSVHICPWNFLPTILLVFQ